MTERVCFDPNLIPNNHLSCEEGPVPPPTSATQLSPAGVSERPKPADSGFSSTWTQSLERHRRLLARQAFSASHPRSIWEGNPINFSPWSFVPVACSQQSPWEHASAGDSGDGGSSTDGGTSPQPNPAPSFQRQGVHAQTPCGQDGIITDLDSDLGVCANYNTHDHHLFRWNPLLSGAAVSLTNLIYPPDQILVLSSGKVVITTHETPGLAWVDPVAGSEGHIPFPDAISLNGVSSSGRNVTSVRPSFPKGIVEIDDQVFVATSNRDSNQNDYLPGTVLVYDPIAATFETLPLKTSGFNPTSLAVSNGLLLVVSSGALNEQGQATTPSYLDVFDPLTHVRLQSLSLPVNGVGLSGELAISDDQRTLVLPTADNSGRLVHVDLQNLKSRVIDLKKEGVSGSRIFFSNIQVSPDGRYAWASNFNDGKTYLVDLETGRVTGSPVSSDSNTLDHLGLGDGLLRGRDLFLGRGSEILRLQYE